MPEPAFDALILAADRQRPDPVTAGTDAICKAFIDLGGQPMVSHVIEALRGSGMIGQITLSVHADCNPRRGAPVPDGLKADDGLEWIDADASVSGSVQSMVQTAGQESRPLLVTTADHPLLTSGHVREFLGRVQESGATAAAGVVPYSLVKTVYPGSVRTRLAFRDELVTGCNLFAFRGAQASPAISFWKQIESYQKQPLRQAMSIGPLTLLSYMAGWLSLRGIIGKLEAKTGVSLDVIRMVDPDLAVDVDSPEDLILVSRILSHRRSAGNGVAREESRQAEVTPIGAARRRTRGAA